MRRGELLDLVRVLSKSCSLLASCLMGEKVVAPVILLCLTASSRHAPSCKWVVPDWPSPSMSILWRPTWIIDAGRQRTVEQSLWQICSSECWAGPPGFRVRQSSLVTWLVKKRSQNAIMLRPAFSPVLCDLSIVNVCYCCTWEQCSSLAEQCSD